MLTTVVQQSIALQSRYKSMVRDPSAKKLISLRLLTSFSDLSSLELKPLPLLLSNPRKKYRKFCRCVILARDEYLHLLQ